MEEIKLIQLIRSLSRYLQGLYIPGGAGFLQQYRTTKTHACALRPRTPPSGSQNRIDLPRTGIHSPHISNTTPPQPLKKNWAAKSPCQDLGWLIPSKIEWDPTNGPLRKLLELLNTQVEGSVQWVLLEISWINGRISPFELDTFFINPQE